MIDIIQKAALAAHHAINGREIEDKERSRITRCWLRHNLIAYDFILDGTPDLEERANIKSKVNEKLDMIFPQLEMKDNHEQCNLNS